MREELLSSLSFIHCQASMFSVDEKAKVFFIAYKLDHVTYEVPLVLVMMYLVHEAAPDHVKDVHKITPLKGGGDETTAW